MALSKIGALQCVRRNLISLITILLSSFFFQGVTSPPYQLEKENNSFLSKITIAFFEMCQNQCQMGNKVAEVMNPKKKKMPIAVSVQELKLHSLTEAILLHIKNVYFRM